MSQTCATCEAIVSSPAGGSGRSTRSRCDACIVVLMSNAPSDPRASGAHCAFVSANVGSARSRFSKTRSRSVGAAPTASA
nr:hypothetical protein [Planotetraspora phitsanulokensis]